MAYLFYVSFVGLTGRPTAAGLDYKTVNYLQENHNQITVRRVCYAICCRCT